MPEKEREEMCLFVIDCVKKQIRIKALESKKLFEIV